MWSPEDAEELRAAIRAGDLAESQTLDLKRELPGPKRSIDLAVDVCAMTPDGGVTIYGVAEENLVATAACPFPLEGQVDRLHQIVGSAISPPPVIRVLPFADQAGGPGQGFIVVIVPPSATAPHMVTVKGEARYYGRNGTVNAPLSESQVASLYERRQRVRDRLAAELLQVESDRTFEIADGAGVLYLYIGPTLRGDEYLTRARERLASTGKEGLPAILSQLLQQADPRQRCQRFQPNLGSLYPWGYSARGLFASTAPDRGADLSETPLEEALKLEVTYEGEVRLWCGRAAELKSFGAPLIREDLIGGLTVHCAALAGRIYEAAGYAGSVDVGVKIDGIRGVVSSESPGGAYRTVGYDAPRYVRTDRVEAARLREDPVGAGRAVLDPLFRTTMGGLHGDYFDRYRQ